MRHVLAAFVLVLLPAQAGLLENGGFERGLEGWRPLNLSGATTFELDAKVKRSGEKSMRIVRAPGKDARVDFLKWSAPLRGKQEKLAVSLAYKVDKDSALHVTAYCFDAKDATIGKGFVDVVVASKATKGFEDTRIELDVPKDAVGVGINVMVEKAGTAWIDDVVVAPVDAAGAKGKTKKPAAQKGIVALANGGFDDDLDGWYAVERGSGTARAERDASVKSAGAASLRIERTSTRLHPEDAWRCDVDDVSGARRARLALKARADGGARAAAVLQAFDERGICVATARVELARAPAKPAPPPGGARFEPAELALDLPKDARRLAVELVVAGEGRAWFDELALEAK